MIVDSMERIARYAGILPHAEVLAKLWADRSAEGAPFEVRDKRYETKDDEKRRFEVHDHTIDLMVGLEGSEVIHICPESELEPAEPLPNGADGRKMNGAPRGHAVILSPGQFVAIYPHEAHMVAGHPGSPASLHKWVVKLPV